MGQNRIWIVWNPEEIQFTVMDTSDQVIHGLVKTKTKEFQFSAVYGLHTVHTRREMWIKLRNLNAQITSPWLIMGDFNSIIDAEDRRYGSEVQAHETKDFKEFLEECKMNESPTVGRTYTWTNNHVYSRIDRAIVNADWMITMPPLQVQIPNPHFLDHSLLRLEVEIPADSGRKPFKFFNYLADYPNFERTVHENWARTKGKMNGVWQNLKTIRKEMKKLNARTKTSEMLHKVETELEELQSNMRGDNVNSEKFDKEKDLKMQLEKWNLVKKSIFKQKSRV